MNLLMSRFNSQCYCLLYLLRHHAKALRVVLLLTVILSTSGVSVANAQEDDSSPSLENSASQQLQEVMQDPLFHRWELRRPESIEVKVNWINDLITVLVDWRDKVINWFKGLWPDFDEPPLPSGDLLPAAGTFFKYLAWVLASVLIVFMVIVMVRLFRGGLRKGQAQVISRERLREALDQGEALAADSSQWIEEATRQAEQDDLRLAYRAMYLALLSGLHKRRSIDFHRQRTNWTYVNHFRGTQDHRIAFADLTTLFDDVWYGLGQPHRQKLQEVRLEIDDLLMEGEAS